MISHRLVSHGARIPAMKKLTVIAFGLLLITLVIAACVTSRASYETAPYKVIRADGAFEIREYPELKIATTQLGKDNDSFMRLFRYIAGGNAKQEKIAMTTPVFMVDGKMAFVVPEKDRANTPEPSSPQVGLDTLKSRRVAVYRFSGGRTKDSEPQAVEKLKAWMRENNLTSTGKPFSAYYDPPWTPGFLRRNEVLTPVATSP
jgi:hypothetical protein